MSRKTYNLIESILGYDTVKISERDLSESILGYVEESKYYRLDDKWAKNDLWVLKHDIDVLFNSVNNDKDLDMLLLQKCKKLLSQIEAAATKHN